MRKWDKGAARDKVKGARAAVAHHTKEHCVAEAAEIDGWNDVDSICWYGSPLHMTLGPPDQAPVQAYVPSICAMQIREACEACAGKCASISAAHASKCPHAPRQNVSTLWKYASGIVRARFVRDGQVQKYTCIGYG